ncbi:MAG: primosomal protein N', partial [Bdellovibrionia bacterium]
MAEAFWQVAVEAPLPTLLTYKSDLEIQRGTAVVVPLGNGNRLINGVVFSQATEVSNPEKIKSIAEVLTEYPVLSDKFMRWLEWLSQYYIYPPGLV